MTSKTTKKRILLILTEFPPAIGGMQTHAINLSRHLHKSGMDIIVYTYRNYDDFLNCNEVDSSFPFPIKRTLSRISYFYSLKLLKKAVESFQPDIIYSSTIFYGILRKMTGIPTICRSAGNDIMRPWIIYPFRFGSRIASNFSIGRVLYRRFKKMNKPEFVEVLLRKKRLDLSIKAAASSDKIIANSKFTKNLLIKAGVFSRKIQISVGGVDISHFKKPHSLDKKSLRKKLGLPIDKILLLTICRLVNKKNIDFLIKSLAIQLTRNKNKHLIIVGDGRRRKNLESLSISLGINDHITFTGAISYQEIPPYFWACDVFILASIVYRDPITELKDAETMGRVLCEANAAGIPVIASHSGGIPSVINDFKNGLLFPENNTKIFHQKLDILLNDQKLYQKLANNGIEIAKQKFDWKYILKDHEKCFNLL